MYREFRTSKIDILNLFKVAFTGLVLSLMHYGTLQAMEQTNSEDFIHKHLLHRVEKLSDHDIYVGAGISAANEKLYYAMEKVTQENILNWLKIGGGNPEDIVRSTIDRLREIYGHIENNTENESYKPEYGDREYYNKLIATLKLNKDKLKSYFEVGCAEVGCQGFGQMIDISSNAYPTCDSSGNFQVAYAPSGNTYVAYASKSPITGPFFSSNLKEIYSIQEFEQVYGNLIMYMCVRDNTQFPTITNRGNQKNPLCNIYGTYRYTAFQFQGFVVSVAAKFFHDKEYTLMGPNYQMGKQLNETMQAGEMFIGIDGMHGSQYADDIYQRFPTIDTKSIGDCLHEADPYSGEECHTIKFGAFAKFYSK